MKKRHLVGIVLAVSGCGGRTQFPVSDSVETDSAEVRIVSNTAGKWDSQANWIVEGNPYLELGELDGAPESILFRIVGVVVLDDGTIVVGDGGSREIRFFSSRGTFIRAVGGAGGGPSEFQVLTWLRRYVGDSLLAYDHGSRRFSVFGPTGDYARSWSLTSPDARSPYMGLELVLETGDMIFSSKDPIRESAVPNVRRFETRLYRYSATGEPGSFLGTFPSIYGFEAPGSAMGVLRFSPALLTATTTGGFYAVDTERYELNRYSVAGKLRLSARLNRAKAAVTPEEIRFARQTELEAVRRYDDYPADIRSFMVKGIRDRVESMPTPDSLPYMSALFVDPRGNVWVRPYLVDSEQGAAEWDVFDESGSFLGQVAVPELVVWQIGMDYIIGSYKDELEVEYVRAFRLRR